MFKQLLPAKCAEVDAEPDVLLAHERGDSGPPIAIDAPTLLGHSFIEPI